MEAEELAEHYKKYLGIFYKAFISTTDEEESKMSQMISLDSNKSYMFIGKLNALRKVIAHYLVQEFMDFEFFTVEDFIKDSMKKNEENQLYMGKKVLILCMTEADNKYGNFENWTNSCVASTIASRYANDDVTLFISEVENNFVETKCQQYMEVINLNGIISSDIRKTEENIEGGGINR